MEQQNFSIYKDNDDIYIRIKNCPENLNNLIVKMLSSIANVSDAGETKDMKPVLDIKDTPIKQEDAKENNIEKEFTWGIYKGMKPSDILNKIGKEKAFVFFYKQKTIYDKVLKQNVADILVKLKRELARKLIIESDEDQPSYDEMNVFFTEYQSLFQVELSEFLKIHNFQNIEEMLKSENDDKYSFYTKMIKKLVM